MNKLYSPYTEKLARRIQNNERISPEEGVKLYQLDLGILGFLANIIRERKNGKKTYFIRNFHVEPTNICIFNCQFCSYSSRVTGNPWEHGLEKIRDIIKKSPADAKEVHITGGVHPNRDVSYYANILKMIRRERPDLHIKAYSAVELEQMIRNSGMSTTEGLRMLQEAGLDSIPGGGAEIFDSEIRKKICPDKADTEQWLEMHRQAHLLDIHSNATMLYGHIESYENRINHMERLRKLQDETHGFHTFIPLKFKRANNPMSHITESSLIDDLKNFAVSRIYLDNFDHIKAYWPMTGKQLAQLSLEFGVDDLDGTINDSTEIYSRAGAEDKNPEMSTNDLKEMIVSAGFEAIERNSNYEAI